MTRPQPRQLPPASAPRRHGRRRATKMTVGVTLLITGATGVTVGAAAYARNPAATNATIARATGNSPALSSAPYTVSSPGIADEENRAGVVAREAPAKTAEGAQTDSRKVAPGLEVKLGKLRVATDPSGVKATSLPLNVTNTSKKTKSFDITVEALDEAGEVITSDVGTAANLRPGQSAEVQVMEIVGDEMAEQLATATFEVADAFAY